MQYYKLILNNEIIGAVTSNNFIYYSPVAQCYLRCDENKGEYISYKGELYRTTWMRPIARQEEYTEVYVTEISQSEYALLEQAIENNDIIEDNDNDEEEPIGIPSNPEDEGMLEFIRSSKIKEMSYMCRNTIENGFDLEIRNEIKHFSLDTQDQLNLMALSIMAQTQSLIPYHADEEECVFYTNDEINEIVDTANAFKIYNTTYYNALKGYINTLSTIEEISAIEYGIEIPLEYQTDVLKALNG